MQILDISIMILYFSVLIIVGVIGSKRAKTADDFIVAGRNLGHFMYLSCLAAVILGGASTLGTAKLGYQFGISGIWLVVMIGLGIIAIGLFLTNKIFDLKVLTISEMLEKRYNSQTRLISALVSVIYTFMLTVTQVIGMGTILHVLAGWNLTVSMIVGGGIVLFYTILGGMWSVTMTDVIQFVIMTIGIFLIMLPMSIFKAGGWSSLHENLPASHFELGNIGGGTIFQYFLLFTLGVVVGQDIWQRLFTARTKSISRSGTIGAGIYSVFYAIAISIIGMCAFIILPDLGDPQTAFTSIAMETLPVGLLGVVIASVVSALMSTASGTLLASSTLVVNDLIKKYIGPGMSERQFVKTSRITTLTIGVMTIIVSIWIQDILVALDVAYAILSGAVFFPIILGFFWKRVTANAAFYSILASMIVIIVGLVIKGPSSTGPILYGLATSFVVITALTLLSPQNEILTKGDATKDIKGKDVDIAN
ncbi:sodium:solute symporter [Peribacillus muralis]|uniref:sodium:solute symporter n=1 Tax=Peribacillus muralis TaxID=264697 RepID=UPI001F4D9CC3|nr:sodium:solute symporter [Peribacillus muralis]MCK1993251.1 sodium:solute symporter [Peribacillus muralis]MCK2013805.1 sodium:solute symporter [Peribacillus muralis]